MKLLIVCNTIDLQYGMVAPTWWQLGKALHEIGNEVIITPYLGHPVQSLWWRTYTNPCLWESILYYSMVDRVQARSIGRKGIFSGLSMAVIKNYIRPRWRKHLLKILEQEGNIEAILFANVPLNHITGIPTELKTRQDIPVLYYDGDLPTSLPAYADNNTFIFDYYPGADLAEYDVFLSSSKGALPLLQELGAGRVEALYYGVDPELYAPVQIDQDIDVFYYGRDHRTKEDRIDFMITRPSRALPDYDFLVAGRHPGIDLGNARTEGSLPISTWRTYCCRSRINVNVTKHIDAETYATSSMRPFELASMGCCVVSDPYNGLEEWFEIGREMFIAHDADEAVATYKKLLASEELRRRTGELARERVLKEHTVKHRARQLIDILQGLKGSRK